MFMNEMQHCIFSKLFKFYFNVLVLLIKNKNVYLQ